jgi:stress response protein YsnF
MRDPIQDEGILPSSPLNSLDMARVVPVIKESLVVDKRVVDQGGYRIVKSVDVREEVVDEPLVAYTVNVERRVIGRLLPSMEVPASRQEGDTWIVSVVEEVLVTEKRLMLKEELHIRRTESVTHHSQTFSLRSENVAIERLEPGVPPVDRKL